MGLNLMALPQVSIIAGWLLGIPVLAVAALVAPWPRLKENLAAHIWCGGVLLLLLLWNVRAEFPGVASVQLLGLTAYTLLVGPALAVAGSALALVIALALQHGAWLNAGAAYVAVALAPIGVTWLMLEVAKRFLPPSLIVHVLVEGWLGGALSLTVFEVVHRVLAPVAPQAMAAVRIDTIAAVACLASGEAMLTGMVLTLFVIHYPDAVVSLPISELAAGRIPPTNRPRPKRSMTNAQ